MDTVLTFCEETGRGSFPAIIGGICQFARTRKWHVENISSKDRVRTLGELLGFWKPVGCIVESGVFLTAPREAFGSVPVVFLNRGPLPTDGGASAVEMDHAALVGAGVAELLRGKPLHVGFVPFLIPSRPWCRARERAFVRRMEATRTPHSLFTPHSKSFCLSRIAFIRELRPWLRKLPKPCAVLAANDETASIAAIACSMEGIPIPKDLALMGIDDDVTRCRNSDPEISSVQPNFSQGAYLAAQLLDRAIRHPRWKGRHVTYAPSGIVRRESTRFLTRNDSEVSAAIGLIKAKACTSLSAADVRKSFSCAKRTADGRFRAVTGQSILEMIHDVRLTRMKELLSNPAQELDAVANLCGYATQNAACKFFRLKTGMTMTAWRNAKGRPAAKA